MESELRIWSKGGRFEVVVLVGVAVLVVVEWELDWRVRSMTLMTEQAEEASKVLRTIIVLFPSDLTVSMGRVREDDDD